MKAAVASAVVGCAACSFLLDHNANQCQVNSDCFRFGGHPSCVNNVCVDSGLQPPDCFYGTPSTDPQFMNECTTALCQSYDDCASLGLCGDAQPPTPVPPPDAGSAPANDAAPAAPSPEAAAPAADAGPALPSCYDPNNGRGQVVYISGSSNFPPLLQQIAPIVIAGNDPTGATPGPTPVFLTTSSCKGVQSMYGLGPTDRLLSDPPSGSTKYAQYFDANGNAVNCLLGGSVPADIGESDVFASTCNAALANSAADVLEQTGPVQAMAFIVPGSSSQRTISAAAALEVFGLGGNGGVSKPWINSNFFYVRSAQTGTQQMIGLGIGVPPGAFWGVPEDSASDLAMVLKGISGSDAEGAIGILSVDYYDSDRDHLIALAYKASEQECAYLPDSTGKTFDKQNVRDGHYPIWGPLHFFVQNPPSPQVSAFLDTLNENQNVTAAFIRASLVPPCAMYVTRNSELGPLQSYAPHGACDCYFAQQVDPTGTAPASCKTCMNDTQCPGSQTCSYGFCEAQ